MDLDIIQSTKEGEITQFLCDVRDYFKASLATSEYENTSNMFYLTASESTEELLNRCECLLNRLKLNNSKLTVNTNINDTNTFSPLQTIQMKNRQWRSIRDTGNNGAVKNSIGAQQTNKELENEDVSYLDMSASPYDMEKKPKHSFETAEVTGKIAELNKSGGTEKTFRCSTLVVRQNKSFLHRLHDSITTTTTTITDDETDAENDRGDNHKEKADDSFEDDAQIYDVCQVTTQGSDGEEDDVGLEETQKAIRQDANFSLAIIDCPYIDLPAGHLAIKKSIKYGNLLKIEKRLFFDQSKKCYCGILNDWLLCYADGPISNRPTVSLYLKIPGIEIEHFGEGKRRDICFQITTLDPNKRFVFQAINEIDAKEWIHAIETAIRSDITDGEVRNSSLRKLPTPPVVKKITFLNTFHVGAEMVSSSTSYDGIYEEPSSIPQIITKSSSKERPPRLPHKKHTTLELSNTFEYDIPKCPPQPLKDNSVNQELLINPYESDEHNSAEKILTIMSPESDSVHLTSSLASARKLNLKMEENLDFQTKVKDVHSKLTSQLPGGPNTKKSLKKSPSAISQNSVESLSLPSLTSPLPDATELKKLKKTSTPSNSPQKNSSEKSSFTKNWFLNKINKTTSSTRSSNSSSPSNSPSKCKQSEKENLLNSSSDICDGNDAPISPILKSSSPRIGTSKVNMIINQLEASGHLASMFNVDTVASLSTCSDNDFNNYEPIMTVSTPPNKLMK